MESTEINLYSNKLLENAIELVKKSSILEKDKELLLKFATSRKANNISDSRVRKCLFHLKTLAKQMPGLENANHQSIESFLGWLNQQPYTEWTKTDFRTILSTFYKWKEADRLGISLKELKRQRKEPELITWFDIKSKSNKKKLPEQLLTEDDVLKLIQNASNPRDKAFVAMLFESGTRIGEIGTMKIKDLTFTDYGVMIKASGKTGPRMVPLVTSTVYLKTWLNQHPDRQNPNAPLWIGDYLKKELHYTMFRKTLKQVAKKAGINKPINPHQFRHSRATILAKSLSEQQLKEYLGWTPDSNMASTYVHLSGKNMEDAILSIYGLKNQNQEQTKMLPRNCECGTVNEPTILFCKKCQKPLTIEAVLQQENQLKKEQKERELTAELKLKEMEEKVNILYQLLGK